MSNKIFILEPRSGLCNQLNCIAIGLMLGVLYERNIYFHGFQNDYSNEDIICNFDQIIDIEHLNKILKDLNLKTIILTELPENKNIQDIPVMVNNNNEPIHKIKDIYLHLNNYYNLHHNILNIKNPISSYIPESYIDFYNNIRSNIKFHKKFIDIANKIKEKYELYNYCCIHLRMEDDAINFGADKYHNTFENINDVHKQIYINEFETLDKIETQKYICTSLVLSENKNNLFYKVIKKKYNLIDKNDIIHDFDIFKDNEYKQRELYGIIDFLIAIDSDYFVGCDWSSFSDSIINNHKLYEKDYNKLKIWEVCSNL